MSRLSWFIVLFTSAYALWMFPQLPERIPVHFGPDGTPDAWGSRWAVFLPVGLSLLMQLVLTIVPKMGAGLSTSIRKAKNPQAELEWALKLIGGVRVWVAGLFLIILWSTVSVALGVATGLTWPFFTYLGIGLVVILSIVIPKAMKPE